MGLDPPHLSTDTLSHLENHPFPGNIRELKNIIERALIQCEGSTILPVHITLARPQTPNAPDEAGQQTFQDLPLNLKDAENTLIRRALEQSHGNIAAAARLLGTNRPRIYSFLKQNPTVE
jgi:DNA-binding NtrC family response regulator